MLQVMIIENTGKKVLMVRGYMGMSATLILLTITLYLQVSGHPVHFYIFQFWDYFTLIPFSSDSAVLDAVLQHGPHFLLHFLFRQRTRYDHHSISFLFVKDFSVTIPFSL